jgi:hypothetical protein
MNGQEWTETDIKLLRTIFSNTASKDLVSTFGRSYAAIICKAKKLGLKKTSRHRSDMTARTNKLVNRDLSFYNVSNIAKMFKTRAEFKQKDPSAYKAAIQNNWLDIISSHMIPQQYSTPQLIMNIIVSNILACKPIYNDRKAIKPLELDVYVPELNIAFEYDGKYWHKEKNEIKTKKCHAANIKLFILTETSRSYEDDIKDQLVSILPAINSYCKTKITAEQIYNVIINYQDVILDYNDLLKICMDNTNYREFKSNFPSIWLKLKRSKLLNKYTSHMKRWTRSV